MFIYVAVIILFAVCFPTVALWLVGLWLAFNVVIFLLVTVSETRDNNKPPR